MASNTPGRPEQPAWRTASFCASGECVEVGQQDGLIMVRDSTQPHGTMLHYAVSEWRSFLQTIQAGNFDGLSL